MKNTKISKILGVGLAIAMLTSLLAVATPASAGTLEWTTESLPTSSTAYQTGLTRSLLDYAVASDNGSTIYGVAGTPDVYKSTNGGSSWTKLALTASAVKRPSVNRVAVSPDNKDIVAAGYSADEVFTIAVTGAGNSYTGRPTVVLTGTGSGASATAYLTGTSVSTSNVTITGGGSGYSTTAPPAVIFTNASGDTTGSGASAVATIAGGIVTGFTWSSGGTGYTGAPSITFAGGGGTGAKATSYLTATTIASVDVTAGGSRYPAAPAITFTRVANDLNIPGRTDATATAALTGAPGVIISTNGAATGESDSWSDAGTIGTLNLLQDLAISPTVSGVRHVAAAGSKTSNSAGIFALNLGGTIAGWTDVTGATFTGSILGGGGSSASAVAFSPNWVSDRVLVAVSNSGSGTFLNVARFLTISTTPATGVWNAATQDLADYTGAGTSNALISTANASTAAIALAPTYLGADPSSRVAFVAVDVGADTGSGVFRMEDAKRKLMEMTDTRFLSVGYDGTTVIAGRADTNNVYRTANPLATTPTVSDITDRFQRPSGGVGATANTTKVAYAGTNVVASTEGNESAFAQSTDGAVTFNDISFIQSSITNILDIAVAPDGSKWYMVSNDAADTSLWSKTGTTWNRLMSIVGNSSAFVIRLAPENKDVVYLVNTNTTNFYYSDDAGQKKWTSRIANENIVDLAVESASVLYYTNGLNVRKSTNAGFLWNDPAVAAFTSGAGYMIQSLGANLVMVTNDAGVVSYSKDGGATWTRPSTLTGGGKIQATAAALTDGAYIYAAGDSFAAVEDNVVYRYTVASVAPDNVWKKLPASSVTGSTATMKFTGIVLKSGILYASTYDTVDGRSILLRALNPTAADTSVIFDGFLTASTTSPDLSIPTITTAPDGGRNSNLRISTGTTGNVLWGIDQDFVVGEETGDSSTTVNDEIYSFTDSLSGAAGVTLSGPADKADIAVNPVTGLPFNITLSWARPSLATAYQYEIGLDNKFVQSVVAPTNYTPADPAITPVTLTIIPGNIGLNTGTTYYWHVRATSPVDSQWSAVRSFTIGSLATPFQMSQPAIGATDVPIKPILSWTPYTGAKWYEVTVSEDPSFAIPEWSHNVGAGVTPPSTVYGVVDALKYGTTYYWRVRGVTADPFVQGTVVITPAGPYVVGAFTTMAEPVAPKPEQVIVTQQAPAPPPQIVQVPVEKIVQQPIPNWMLMTIIVIGAVLVIALIVLIVRTRRVA